MWNNFLYTWYVNTGPGTWTAGGAQPDDFIGGYATEALGDEHVSAIGDLFYAFGESVIWIVTAYDAGTTVYGYHWVTPQEIVALNARNNIPDGVTDGQGLIWNSGDWEPSQPFAFTSDLNILFDGHGSPSVPPTESQKLAINESGDVYASEGIDVVHTAPSSWSTAPADVDWTHYKGVQRFVNSSVLTTEKRLHVRCKPAFLDCE